MSVLTHKFVRILLIVISLWLICFTTEHVLAANHPLQDALVITGAKIQEINVDGWTRLNTSYLEDNELTKTMKKLVANIPYSIKEVEIKHSSGSYFNGLTLSGNLIKDMKIFINIQSISHKLSKKAQDETFLSINVNELGESVSLHEIEGLIKEIFQKSGLNGQIASCLTGRINGKLGKVSKSKIIIKVVKQLNLRIVQQDINDDTMSMIAYSPFFKNSIHLQGQVININLASRYDELKNQTEIYLGTPIISVDL